MKVVKIDCCQLIRQLSFFLYLLYHHRSVCLVRVEQFFHHYNEIIR